MGDIKTEQVTVTVCPDGPLLIRGPFTLRSADGTLVDSNRSVLALCRCGRSRLKPLCDGSHKAARFRDDAAADDLQHLLDTATHRERKTLADRVEDSL